jgi:predicted ATPase
MIDRFHVRNYRSLRDVEVEFAPVTVLIGRSGTGKSNIVNAMRFLRTYLVNRNDQFVQVSGGWAASFCATATEPRIGFEVVFRIPGVRGEFGYELVLHRADVAGTFSLQDRAVEERLSVDQRTLFHQNRLEWVTAPQLANPPQPGALMLGARYGIPEVKIAHLALTRGLGCYDFPGNVLTGGKTNDTGAGLNDDASDYLKAYEGIAEDLSSLASFQQIMAGLQRLNGSVTSVELETTQRSHLIVGHRVADAKVLAFPLAQESEGFRRVLAHLIALYQMPPRQTLVFEEPEKGIFPGALSMLAEYFKAAADAGRSQVILTTHSPELLSHFAPEQIRVVEMAGYETRVGPVSAEQMVALRESLLTSGELLTVDVARLDSDPTGN